MHYSYTYIDTTENMSEFGGNRTDNYSIDQISDQFWHTPWHVLGQLRQPLWDFPCALTRNTHPMWQTTWSRNAWLSDMCAQCLHTHTQSVSLDFQDISLSTEKLVVTAGVRAADITARTKIHRKMVGLGFNRSICWIYLVRNAEQAAGQTVDLAARWFEMPRLSCDAFPDSKVHGANMGPIWGWQHPGGPHVGPMNFAIWVYNATRLLLRISRLVWSVILYYILFPWCAVPQIRNFSLHSILRGPLFNHPTSETYEHMLIGWYFLTCYHRQSCWVRLYQSFLVALMQAAQTCHTKQLSI